MHVIMYAFHKDAFCVVSKTMNELSIGGRVYELCKMPAILSKYIYINGAMASTSTTSDGIRPRSYHLASPAQARRAQ